MKNSEENEPLWQKCITMKDSVDIMKIHLYENNLSYWWKSIVKWKWIINMKVGNSDRTEMKIKINDKNTNLNYHFFIKTDLSKYSIYQICQVSRLPFGVQIITVMKFIFAFSSFWWHVFCNEIRFKYENKQK